MKSDEKQPGKFYCTFKVHKPHTINEAPREKPIISGSGSMTENPSLFVEHFIKDTPAFLRQIELVNEGQKLPKNALLATVDVTGLLKKYSTRQGSTNSRRNTGQKRCEKCANPE